MLAAHVHPAAVIGAIALIVGAVMILFCDGEP